jgi:hypothetical protein
MTGGARDVGGTEWRPRARIGTRRRARLNAKRVDGVVVVVDCHVPRCSSIRSSSCSSSSSSSSSDKNSCPGSGSRRSTTSEIRRTQPPTHGSTPTYPRGQDTGKQRSEPIVPQKQEQRRLQPCGGAAICFLHRIRRSAFEGGWRVGDWTKCRCSRRRRRAPPRRSPRQQPPTPWVSTKAAIPTNVGRTFRICPWRAHP